MPDRAPADDDLSRRIRLVMALRGAGVHDTRLLSAMEQVPREWFVDEALRAEAYEDVALPLACGQAVTQPTVVARMIEELEVDPRHTVLEIGTGSGYQTAVLSRLSRRVYTIERHRTLLDQALRRFAALGYTNIVARCGDGGKGWKEAAPFDRIIVNAAARDIPPALTAQLRESGIMTLPLGDLPERRTLTVVQKDMGGDITRREVMPLHFSELIE
ncbi:MAG: protein-L-isoaspartate(D-aspartate) O-methyltransferase [Alphaproteobacteria bacterium]|nr:protein-L-isoaspartate(D-aspartate) O-methyltransferase [Alphaproteobacteria bacterium]